VNRPTLRPAPSKFRNAASRPGDDAEVYCGGWSRERLIAMDARYCEVMRASLIKDIRPEARRSASGHDGSRALLAAAAERP
jgi:hypothetical protein